jgi:hypothetical protein
LSIPDKVVAAGVSVIGDHAAATQFTQKKYLKKSVTKSGVECLRPFKEKNEKVSGCINEGEESLGMAAVAEAFGDSADSFGATSTSTEFPRSDYSQSVLRASLGGT